MGYLAALDNLLNSLLILAGRLTDVIVPKGKPAIYIAKTNKVFITKRKLAVRFSLDMFVIKTVSITITVYSYPYYSPLIYRTILS